MGEGKSKLGRPRRGIRRGRLAGQVLTAFLAFPAAYMVAALIGTFISVNRGWVEPGEGITVYLADNGIHTDILLPAEAEGMDWEPFVPKAEFAAVPPGARWLAFGSGEERVYLQTPRWQDISLRTIWSALTGGKRVIHAEWVDDPSYAQREIRLRPEEYRRLWSAIRSDFRRGPDGRAMRLDHPGYGCCDSFYRQTGTFNALTSCNTWVADKLRLAGVEASLWPPFTNSLLWRYRRTGQST